VYIIYHDCSAAVADAFWTFHALHRTGFMFCIIRSHRQLTKRALGQSWTYLSGPHKFIFFGAGNVPCCPHDEHGFQRNNSGSATGLTPSSGTQAKGAAKRLRRPNPIAALSSDGQRQPCHVPRRWRRLLRRHPLSIARTPSFRDVQPQVNPQLSESLGVSRSSARTGRSMPARRHRNTSMPAPNSSRSRIG